MTTRRGLGALFLAAGAVVWLAALDAGGGEAPQARDVYVRQKHDVPASVDWLRKEADRLDVAQILFVFDAATFAPPPGQTEFSWEYLYPDDLSAWLDALGRWAAASDRPLRATTSFAPNTIRIGSSSWRSKLEADVNHAWWKSAAIHRVEPAVSWMNRLLARTEPMVHGDNRENLRMLVLVAGGVSPERWISYDHREPWEASWRKKLLPQGAYWKEEQIAQRLLKDRCRLYVVAPEVRFGDFAPYVELPKAPWAARPMFPPLRPGPGWEKLADPPDPKGPRGVSRDSLRRAIDESLKERFPDPEERAREVERILRELRSRLPGAVGPLVPLPGGPTASPGPVTPGLRPTVPLPQPEHVPLHQTGLRFISATPIWFPFLGNRYPYGNHAPSGYGWWPYARAAAKTRGRYLFYPFPDLSWLDVCPRDPNQINDLAPELVNRQRYLSLRRGDRALDAIQRAMGLVVKKTPWADTRFQHRAATGWSSFERVAPLKMQADWFHRRCPFDLALSGSEHDIRRLGERIRDDVLPRYDQALGILDRALRRGPGPRTHPRSMANLRLARYHFAMSAFHLDALAIYAREVDRFIPEDMKGDVDRIYVTYVPTIKMSDCLHAYDGRRLDLAQEARYPRLVPRNAPGYQGNILRIPTSEPDYRAERSLASVLRYLDTRLRRRAWVMIHAARDVMEHHARTGWGWTTYYSEAHTFVFKPGRTPRGPNPWMGEHEKPEEPTKPEGPPTPPGGSVPGGPGTGGP